MAFLYRGLAAIALAMLLAAFSVVALGQPVTPRTFYGGLGALFLASYIADAVAVWRLKRAAAKLRKGW